MNEIDKKNAVDVEMIEGDNNIVAKENLTPGDYFNYVKNMKSIADIAEFEQLRDSCMSLLKKAVITGQKKMAQELTRQYNIVLKEIRAIENGYNVIIFRTDVEKYINDLQENPIRIIELENYERDVPDDVINKIADIKEKKLFDRLYVIFTDYSLKETKKIAKHRHEKDPILFGSFNCAVEDESNTKSKKRYIPDERMFFIADWVDEKCDLTLEELVKKYEAKTGEQLAFTPKIPTSPDELKKYINSMGDKEEAKENAQSFFGKMKETVKKATTRRRTTSRKKKVDDAE